VEMAEVLQVFWHDLWRYFHEKKYRISGL
jgi:hypothetical protein